MPFSFLCTRRTRFYDPFYFKFGVSVFAFSFRSHLCKIRDQQIYTNTIFGKCSKASRAAVLFEWSMIKVIPAPRTVLSCINSKIPSQAPPNAAQTQSNEFTNSREGSNGLAFFSRCDGFSDLPKYPIYVQSYRDGLMHHWA